jgi:hypothetical protein
MVPRVIRAMVRALRAPTREVPVDVKVVLVRHLIRYATRGRR